MNEENEIMTSREPSIEELNQLKEAVTLRLQRISTIDEDIERLVDAATVGKEIEHTLTFKDKVTSFPMKTRKFLRSQNAGLPKGGYNLFDAESGKKI